MIIAVLTIAEKWADYMEERMLDGTPLERVAIETHQIATNGVDSLKLHTAWGDVMIDHLNGCWEEGERLNAWYYGR